MKRSIRILLFILVLSAVAFIMPDTYAATKYKYTITYNLDYGTNCSNNPAGFNKNNKKIVLCEPTRKGYQFGGWYTDKAMTKKVATIKKNKNSNVTLYAKWIKNKYYVKYDANTATGTMATSTFKYNTNYLLSTNTFTKKGYTFTGWNTKADGTGISYTDGQKIKSLTNKNGKTITLYAQWRKNIYYVQYHNNGGTGKIKMSTLRYGKTYNLPTSTFTREDYTFVGWNTKKDGSGISYTDGQAIKNLTNKDGKVITLYAQWKSKQKYVIIFSTGVTGQDMDSITCYYNEKCKLPNTVLKHDNYYHIGWSYYGPDGSETIYDIGAKVKLKETGIVFLYSKWTTYYQYKANEVANKIIKEKITSDMDTKTKIKVLHNYLVNTTKYDELALNDTSPYQSHSAYGALVEHNAVCDGYTGAMQLFLNKLGIENERIVMNYHTWNYVKVDGKWLHLDATWDDPIMPDRSDVLIYDYFLIDDNTILSKNDGTHKLGPGETFNDYMVVW